jgi:hypothetical protein
MHNSHEDMLVASLLWLTSVLSFARLVVNHDHFAGERMMTVLHRNGCRKGLNTHFNGQASQPHGIETPKARTFNNIKRMPPKNGHFIETL